MPCALDSYETNLADFHNYYNLIINPAGVGYAAGQRSQGSGSGDQAAAETNRLQVVSRDLSSAVSLGRNHEAANSKRPLQLQNVCAWSGNVSLPTTIPPVSNALEKR